MFKPTDAPRVHADLDLFTQCMTQTVTNLGVRQDNDFKHDALIKLLIKSHFCHLRQMVTLFLSQHYFQILIQDFIQACLDYYSGLFVRLNLSLLN